MDYQTKDVLKIVDIKMSQLQYWTRLGVVKADIRGPTSQGKARLFSPMNLFEFSLVRELTKRGVAAIDTKDILEKVRESFPSFIDEEPKYELITWRTITDLWLVYFGKAFFLENLLDMETKGVSHIWFKEQPPSEFMTHIQIHGFSMKVSVVLQYYDYALVLNLENLKLSLKKRLQEGA